MHKKLGGDKAGTADPKQPKGYSTLYNVTLTIYFEEGRGMLGVLVFVFPSNSYL